jgi:hypothetical protein
VASRTAHSTVQRRFNRIFNTCVAAPLCGFVAACTRAPVGPDYAREKRRADEVVLGEAVSLKTAAAPAFLGILTAAKDAKDAKPVAARTGDDVTR